MFDAHPNSAIHVADRVQPTQSRQEESRCIGPNPQGDAVLRAGRPVQVARSPTPPSSWRRRASPRARAVWSSLLERKKRLKEILPRHKLIAFSRHRKTDGTKFFEEAERRGLEGIMAKRADSKYLSGSRTDNWLKIKTSKRQEVVIAGFTAPRRTRPFFGALALAMREKNGWRYIGHVGTGFSHKTLEELHGKLIKLKTAKSPFAAKVKDEAVTTWVKPSLVAEVKFTEWTTKGEMRHPVYLGLRADKRAEDVTREREKPEHNNMAGK